MGKGPRVKVVFRCFPEWETLLPKPFPASDALPEWLRSMPAAVHSDILGAQVRTAKHCVPFIDALSRGFMVPLAADVSVSDSNFSWSWDLPPLSQSRITRAPISFHLGEQVTGTPLADSDSLVVKFNNFWTIETPPEHSLLITHPLNRPDLPFRTVAGIVDCDRYSHGFVHFPARWTDQRFTGTLHRGTPVAQCFVLPRRAIELVFETLHDEHAQAQRETHDDIANEAGGYRHHYRARR